MDTVWIFSRILCLGKIKNKNWSLLLKLILPLQSNACSTATMRMLEKLPKKKYIYSFTRNKYYVYQLPNILIWTYTLHYRVAIGSKIWRITTTPVLQFSITSTIYLCAVVMMASTTSMILCKAESVPMVISVPQKSLSMDPTIPTMLR